MAEAGVKNMANRNAAQRQQETEEQEMSRDMDHDDTKMSRESLERMGLEVSLADGPEGNNEVKTLSSKMLKLESEVFVVLSILCGCYLMLRNLHI